MSILKKLIRRKKVDLRELCREAYGEAFVAQYDKLCAGCPIGDIDTTIDFLEKIGKIKKQWNIK